MKVYAFDFDGTLTKKDTFIEFIEYSKGYGKTFFGLLLFSPILILMKLHLYPNWKAKQRIFSWFFKGMNIDEFNKLCQNFFQPHNPWLNSVHKRQHIIMEGCLQISHLIQLI